MEKTRRVRRIVVSVAVLTALIALDSARWAMTSDNPQREDLSHYVEASIASLEKYNPPGAEELPGGVFGHTVDEKGIPLSGVPVYCTEWRFSRRTVRQLGVSKEKGRFDLTCFPNDARYQFFFGRPQYGSHGSDFGFTRLRSGKHGGDLMEFKSAEWRDLGDVVVPRSDAVLAGRVVTREGGVPAGSLLIEIKGEHTSDCFGADPATGRFRFAHIVHEPLTLQVFHSHNSDNGSFPNGIQVKDRRAADPRPVRAGDESVVVTLW